MVGPDAGEGSGWDAAPVNKVVLQVRGDEVGVLGHTCVTDGIQGHMSVEEGLQDEPRPQKGESGIRREERKRGPTVDGGDTKAQTPGPGWRVTWPLGAPNLSRPPPAQILLPATGHSLQSQRSRWAHGGREECPHSAAASLWGPCVMSPQARISGQPARWGLRVSAELPPSQTGGGDRPGRDGGREQQDVALPDLVVAQT